MSINHPFQSVFNVLHRCQKLKKIVPKSGTLSLYLSITISLFDVYTQLLEFRFRIWNHNIDQNVFKIITKNKYIFKNLDSIYSVNVFELANVSIQKSSKKNHI